MLRCKSPTTPQGDTHTPVEYQVPVASGYFYSPDTFPVSRNRKKEGTDLQKKDQYRGIFFGKEKRWTPRTGRSQEWLFICLVSSLLCAVSAVTVKSRILRRVFFQIRLGKSVYPFDFGPYSLNGFWYVF